MNYEIVNTTGNALQQFSSSLYDSWVKYLDVAPKSIETYTRAIRQFAKYTADNGIDAPEREDVISFREYLRESGKKPTTIQAYITAVKLFFQWTEQTGRYPDVARHIKGAKLDREHKKDYLTSRQAGKVLKTIDTTTLQGKRDFALVALMTTTGLRTISVVNANVEDLRTVGDDTALYYQGKGHEEKAACVKVAPQVEAAIRDYLKARGASKGQDPLFASEAHRNAGERMTTRSVSRIAKESMVAAGYDSDKLTAHSLRHTAGTLALLNGASLEETQQMLGHASINTTMIYNHAIQRARNNSEIKVAAAIFA